MVALQNQPQNNPQQQNPGGKPPPAMATAVPPHFAQAGIQQHPNPMTQGPNPFDRAIPGQSLTDTPKNSPWEHPPQYTNLHDALQYVFDQLLKPINMKQTLAFLQKGIPVEELARMIIFTGFTTGHWTPDLAMMMGKPVCSIIAGIAVRAGVKDAKMTNNDRTGFHHLYRISNMPQLTSSSPTPPPTPTKAALKGFMSKGQ